MHAIKRLNCAGHIIERHIPADSGNNTRHEMNIACVTRRVRANAKYRSRCGRQLLLDGRLIQEQFIATH